MKKNIFIIAIGYLPNIGGLETHLKDLTDELIKRDWDIKVLTYQPLHSPTFGKWIEEEKNLTIFRLPTLRGVFYKLLKNPFLEFLFLEPLIFLSTPIVLIRNPQIEIINAQGIIAGFSAAFWNMIFKKRYVISVQSVYHFPKRGLYKMVCKWIFQSADKIVAISKQAKQDVETLGIDSDKIQLYTNWENGDFFKPYKKELARKEVGFSSKFAVSFFGRLIEEKGVKVIVNAAKLFDKGIVLVIYGEGPLNDYVMDAVEKNENIIFMKTVPPDFLPIHYSAADVVVMPTLNEEGFGRVAAGALFCGTPVISSNRGALPEVVNESVGKVIEPISSEIAKAVNYFFSNKAALKKRSLSARSYALSKFSRKNVEAIIDAYI